MKHKNNPYSIEVVGLRSHLESTKPYHNNYGFDDFTKMVQHKTRVADIARAFNVSRTTVYTWLAFVFDKP